VTHLGQLGDVDRVQHQHIPVAGLRLLEDRERFAGGRELLGVDLDAVGLLEGLQQTRVRVIAPDQCIDFLGRLGAANDGEAADGGGAGGTRLQQTAA
jgi:hypothetical protein